MKNIIKTLLFEWKARKIPELIDRNVELKNYLAEPKKIIVITGFRRVGKTYLSFQFLKTLLETYDKEQVIYINLEDERIPQTTEFLTELIPTIKETISSKIYLICLDELQVISNWSKWLRRIYDTEDFFIFVTGSSSKLSLNEIPTELRGRFIHKEIFPLSFNEFLKFKKITIDQKNIEYVSDEKAMIGRLLNEYLTYGGLPEIVLSSEERKTELLQNYYSTVVSRDIIERFHVKNEEGMKALLRLLINSTSYSLNKSYNVLKSINLTIGKTSLITYVSYIESSYFLYSLPIFSPTIKDQLQYPRKIYLIDNGFITSLSVKNSDKTGRLYENTVFLELLRRKKVNQEIHYWQSQQKEEVDFVIIEEIKVKQLIQVCYSIDDYDTKKRELKALLKASTELKCKQLLVITKDYEKEEKIGNQKINYIPLWKWLLTKKV